MKAGVSDQGCPLPAGDAQRGNGMLIFRSQGRGKASSFLFQLKLFNSIPVVAGYIQITQMNDSLFLFKFQAYGNDFLVTEDHVPEELLSRTAVAACDRHFGIGGDGLLTLRKDPGASYALRIINADGSEAGMSGNGGRCAAAYLHLIKGLPDRDITFSTISGDKVYSLREKNGFSGSYQSMMGFPSFSPASVPFECGEAGLESVDDFLLSSPGLEERVYALSVGNPQCVVFRDTLPGPDEQARIGRIIENHAFFPERTNVSFVQVINRTHVRIKIWERGVGVTSSSGTGSCGAAVAAIRSGRADSRLEVETDTGKQIVEWREGSQIRLTGDVEFVAEIKMRIKAPRV